MGRMKTIAARGAAVLAGGTMLFAAATANAGVMFFTDQTAFLGATTTSLIDFEGIVGDGGNQVGTPLVVSGVSFSAPGSGDSIVLAGKNVGAGSPFDSALIATGNGGQINMDFSAVGPLTAAGGIFGDSDSAGSTAVLRLFGAGNVLLDTQNIFVGDMGAGEPRTFFGWTTDGGDVVTRIEYNMDGTFEAVDDIRFGTAGAVVAVSETGTMAIFGLGLLGMAYARRRRET